MSGHSSFVLHGPGGTARLEGIPWAQVSVPQDVLIAALISIRTGCTSPGIPDDLRRCLNEEGRAWLDQYYRHAGPLPDPGGPR